MPARANPPLARARDEPTARLRLYVARSTPNSVRAEHNLSAVLDRLREVIDAPAVELIDVFLQPRRAMSDGVVVTPTLVGLNAGRRVLLMGDLADQAHLQSVLQDLFATNAQPH